jgi:hypothetical protein
MKELSKFELSLNIIVKYRRIKPAFYGVHEKNKYHGIYYSHLNQPKG